LKCKDIKDTTQSFIIKQMLKGMTRLYGVPDVRLSISIEMIKQIPKALSHTPKLVGFVDILLKH
jgi:hypothetical protein